MFLAKIRALHSLSFDSNEAAHVKTLRARNLSDVCIRGATKEGKNWKTVARNGRMKPENNQDKIGAIIYLLSSSFVSVSETLDAERLKFPLIPALFIRRP